MTHQEIFQKIVNQEPHRTKRDKIKSFAKKWGKEWELINAYYYGAKISKPALACFQIFPDEKGLDDYINGELD